MPDNTELVVKPPVPAVVQSVADDMVAANEMAVMAARSGEAQAEIAAILSQMAPAAEPVDAEPAAQVKPADVPPPVEGVTTDPPPATPENKEPAPEERGFLRLMELEGQVRMQREALEARERAIQDKEREMEAKYGTRLDPAELARRLQVEPSKTLETLGISPEVMSALIVTDRLGDKAPPEARRLAEQFQVKREIEQLRRQLQERDYYLARERAYAGAKDFIGTSDGTSKYPTLAAVAAVDKDRVANAVLAEVERMAQKPGFNLDAKAYASAAEAVEKQWEVFSRAFVSKAPDTAGTNVSPPAPAIVPPAANTLNQVAPKPAAPPSPITPAPAPAKQKRPYWEDPEWEAAKATALTEAMKAAGVRS